MDKIIILVVNWLNKNLKQHEPVRVPVRIKSKYE